MAGNFDNIRFTCSWCLGQVALIMLLSINWRADISELQEDLHRKQGVRVFCHYFFDFPRFIHPAILFTSPDRTAPISVLCGHSK